MARTQIDPSLIPSLQGMLSYRRPQLEWNSVTQVSPKDVVVANQVDIIFPDGAYRTETTLTQYRFDITRNAVLTGSKQSGLRTGLSEATNTWYAIYAVKAQDTTGIVTVGDTVLPIRANLSTLNSNFGTNSWVFLGMIRNGDQSGTTGDILDFIQCGDMTIFRNAVVSGDGTTRGIRLASATGVSTVTYTYSQGTSGAVIPNNLGQLMYTTVHSPGSTGINYVNSASGTLILNQVTNQSGTTFLNTWIDAPTGAQAGGPASSNLRICLSGFTDTALGVGANPLV